MTWVLANYRILIVGAIVLALGVQTWRLDRYQQEYSNFKVTIEALGRAQKAKLEEDAKFNNEVTNETIAAKDRAISDLSTRYAAARKRLYERSRSGGVPQAAPPATIVAACEGGSAERLADLEARILDLLERADREIAKYAALWEWAQKVR